MPAEKQFKSRSWPWRRAGAAKAQDSTPTMWSRVAGFSESVFAGQDGAAKGAGDPANEDRPPLGEVNEPSGAVRTTVTDCLSAHGIRTMDVALRQSLPAGHFKLYVTVGSDAEMAQLQSMEPVLATAVQRLHQRVVIQVWWRLHPVVGRN